MKMSKIFLSLFICMFLTSCEHYGIVIDGESKGGGDYGNSPSYERGHPGQTKKGGPPPHALAHGYRKKHKYTYYPEREVYYSGERNCYFWYRDGKWEFGAKLPGNISLKTSSSVSLELETDMPHKVHAEVVNKYPGKGKGNSYGKGKGKSKNKKKDK